MELKDAMQIGKDFVADVTGDVENLQLEEVALSADKSKIEVVYSFDKKLASPNSLQRALGLEGLRSFKKVVIDSASGDVLGMYNWSYETRQAA
jgi:hypothetical protein